jgi:hypothetical protein
MNKKLIDYAHLYFGCLLWLEYKDGSGGIAWLDYYWLGYFNGKYIEIKPTSLKLILRPLSSITNEERLERGKAIIKFGKAEIEAEYHRWMLSKGFDMFELIEAGIALDKTKIKGNDKV